MTFATAREVRHNVAEMLRPPLRVSVAEGAAKSLVLADPGGGGGKWSPEATPYMIEPMNLATSRLYEAVVFVGPARSGKTLALVDGVITYSVTCDPADTMVVQTNQSAAEDYSKTRIGRTIQASADLSTRLSTRAHDDNVLLKFFRSGMGLRLAWPSLGQLSGKDVRRMLLTDVDNFSGDLSIDEAFGLALKRTQTYMSAGIVIAESSPARDFLAPNWRPSTPHEAPPAGGILSLYNRGDRRRYYWPCPECGEFFEAKPGLELFNVPPLDDLLERVKSESVNDLAEQWAHVGCPSCGVQLQQSQRRAMNASAVWLADGQSIDRERRISGDVPRSRTASFWLGGAAAAWQSWSSLIERYLQAVKAYALTGEQKQLKTTVNVDQAMPWQPLSALRERSPHALQARCETWPAGLVPKGVRFLTAAVDVQAHRFVVQVEGRGEGLERWIIDRYSLNSSERDNGLGGKHPIDPASYGEDWDRLVEKVIERRYALVDATDRSLPIMATLIDSGGRAGVTEKAYAFWRRLKTKGLHRKVRLVKGASTDNAPRFRETFPDARARKDRNSGGIADVPLLMINTKQAKDAVAADLMREEPGPGFFHLPTWLPTTFFEELTAEVRSATGWINPRKSRNEAFDLAVYNTIAVAWIKGEAIDWAKPPTWAAEWDGNPDVTPHKVEQVKPAKPAVLKFNPMMRRT